MPSKAATTQPVAPAYAGALDHYLSPRRRDAVKTMWEEPATRALLDSVVERATEASGRLHVLDIGCGTGEGLALLEATPAWRRLRARGESPRYIGLDVEERLVDAARWMHEGSGATFLTGDMRDELPPGDFGVYLSTGVPFSHLTEAELASVLERIFAQAAGRSAPSAVVVDVLGRYSVEWTSRWGRGRWPYRMSFFASDKEPVDVDMTFYGSEDLREVVSAAAASAGCPLSEIACHDRSILVGRHSATREFNPGLRPYRTLVNRLVDPEAAVTYEDLLFEPEGDGAPGEVAAFYVDFARAWNGLVTKTATIGGSVDDPDHVTAVVQPMLAHGLRRLEATMQRGLGVGHSLTAVAWTDPRV